jgi:large subunit ribosomal protein L4e
MFAPTKTWRRWHRKVNVNQRRYALASALAASALPSLVLARGHRIEEVPEVPLILATETLKELSKTSAAIKLLKTVKALDDVEKAKDSRKLRRGKGKMRNRRYVQRRGPLIVHDTNDKLDHAFRNLPGVELANVERLNLLQLAPGGHLGRFVVWTQNAFAKLDQLYGTYTRPSTKKTEYRLPRPLLANPDISRVINSDEVQSKLRPKKARNVFKPLKKNPLRNLGALVKLNPYAKTLRRRAVLLSQKAARDAAIAKKRASKPAPAKAKAAPKAAPKGAAKPKLSLTKLKKQTRKSHAGFLKILKS